MGKNKNRCWPCSQKHYPPTGKNCVFVKEKQQLAAEVPSEDDARDSSSSKVSPHKKSVASEKDSVVQKVYTSGQRSHSESDGGESSMEEGGQLDIQQKILVQLEKVSSRLEVVESQMGGGTRLQKEESKAWTEVKYCQKMFKK